MGIIFSLISCKKEKAIEWESIYKSNKNEQRNFPIYRLSKEKKQLLKLISDKEHSFTPVINFKRLEYYRSLNNNITFIWEVDTNKTDFDVLQKWKIGIILKPKQASQFKDSILRIKGIKTMGVLTNLKDLDGRVIITLDNFYFKPDKLSYIKFYLYNNEGEVNLNYWTIKNLKLD